jgi:hypothetical protein
MFRSMTIIRELVLNIAKVKIVKSWVKIRRYKLCCSVAAYYVKSLKRSFTDLTQYAATTLHAHNDVFLLNF